MISKKSKYALKALGYLAGRHRSGPVVVSAIANDRNIPLKFLESILLTLKNHHILISKKGQGGGYLLARPPAKITIAEVLRAIDGPIAPLPCVSLNFYEKCEDCNERSCSVRKIMAATRDATLKVLEKKTVQDLVIR